MERDLDVGRPRARRDGRLEVLVVDRSPPVEIVQGNALIGRHLFPRLRRHHRLTLVAFTDPRADASVGDLGSQLAEQFDEAHLVPRSTPVRTVADWFGPPAARVGLRTTQGPDAPAARRMRALLAALATRPFDVVHTRQLPMALYGAGLEPRSRRLLELVDSETLGALRAADPGPRGRLRRLVARAVERQSLRRFPIVTSVAEADAAVMRQLVPCARVEVVPNGVDSEHYRPMPSVPEVPDSLVFLGAMSYPPNVAAARHFAERIFPLIREAQPYACLTIVGRDPAPEIRALARTPGIDVTGWVDDVRPYLARAAIFVCPMVSGSGIKNKVLEAMAMGRPVVTTPLGVEGLSSDARQAVVRAAEPAEFAAAVVRLQGEPVERERLGEAARAVVEREYSWDACADRYDALYRELATTPVAGRDVQRWARSD